MIGGAVPTRCEHCDRYCDGECPMSREAAMDEKGYNGWSNYPTWCVNLWLSNDEGLYREALELARTCAARGDELVRGKTADVFKAWVRDELAPDLGASFAADLLGYALDSVDWFEIADAWLEQVEEVTSG